MKKFVKDLKLFFGEEDGKVSKEVLLGVSSLIAGLSFSLLSKPVNASIVHSNNIGVSYSGTTAVGTHQHHSTHSSYGSHATHSTYGSHATHSTYGSHATHSTYGSHATHSTYGSHATHSSHVSCADAGYHLSSSGDIC